MKCNGHNHEKILTWKAFSSFNSLLVYKFPSRSPAMWPCVYFTGFRGERSMHSFPVSFSKYFSLPVRRTTQIRRDFSLLTFLSVDLLSMLSWFFGTQWLYDSCMSYYENIWTVTKAACILLRKKEVISLKEWRQIIIDCPLTPSIS